MDRFKKHIAFLLLAVFSLAVLPAPALHEWFADHTDATENHCHYYHKDLGRHIEEQQDHCDVFKNHVPVYDALKIEVAFAPVSCLMIVYHSGAISSLSYTHTPRVPARAPPTA